MSLELKAPPTNPIAWRFRATYMKNGEPHFDYATFVSQTWFGARARALRTFAGAVRVEHESLGLPVDETERVFL